MTGDPRRLVRPVRNGPVLIAGPVRIEMPDRVVESDRFLVAICACGRSKDYPLCDTSHRVRDTSYRVRCRDERRQTAPGRDDG